MNTYSYLWFAEEGGGVWSSLILLLMLKLTVSQSHGQPGLSSRRGDHIGWKREEIFRGLLSNSEFVVYLYRCILFVVKYQSFNRRKFWLK